MPRYPEIDFYLSVTPFDPFELFEDQEGKRNGKKGDLQLHLSNLEAELTSFMSHVDLTHIELLYVYGV